MFGAYPSEKSAFVGFCARSCIFQHLDDYFRGRALIERIDTKIRGKCGIFIGQAEKRGRRVSSGHANEKRHPGSGRTRTSVRRRDTQGTIGTTSVFVNPSQARKDVRREFRSRDHTARAGRRSVVIIDVTNRSGEKHHVRGRGGDGGHARTFHR